MYYILVFLSGAASVVWLYVGYLTWRYATERASGSRGLIFNPSDDLHNPFVWVAMVMWLILWPVFAMISATYYSDWRFKDVFFEPR